MKRALTRTIKRLMRSRTILLLDHDFFGALSLRLEFRERTAGCPTAATDGTHIFANPAYIEGLTDEESLGLLAHEVGHCALGHVWRRGGRDPLRWNIACDLVLNWELTQAGFTLPEGCLLDKRYAGKTAEWVYSHLPEDQGGWGGTGYGPEEDGEGSEAGEGDAGDAAGDASDGGGTSTQYGPPGEVWDPAADATEEATEEQWRRAVEIAAESARARGTLPGAFEGFIQAASRVKVDWRRQLHRFAQERAQHTYSWAKPVRRYVPHDLFLPSLSGKDMGPCVLLFDSSGSVYDALLAEFFAEAQAVIDECRPLHTDVLMVDTRVAWHRRFERGDPLEVVIRGRGGTDFRPGFEWIEENLDEEPSFVIYLTDLYGDFPDREPDYPVLWAWAPNNYADEPPEVPWGEVVRIEE